MLTLAFRMWLGVWLCLFCTSRQLICRKWTVRYQCRYFTINSSISECDHKCNTRNAEPEIGTDGSSQTLRNLRLDGYGSRIGLPRVSGWGFWTGLELNQLGFAVLIRTPGGLPGPVANTTPNAWSHSASKSLLRPFAWWHRHVDCSVDLLCMSTGSGVKFFFRALTIVSFVDFVVGQDVGCWKIWTTWRQAEPCMSRFVRLINSNKAKSAF
jgi:hypothetical protein